MSILSILKIIDVLLTAATGLLAMIGILIYGFAVGNFSTEGTKLLSMPCCPPTRSGSPSPAATMPRLAGTGPRPRIIQQRSPGKNNRHELCRRVWTSCLL